MEISSDRKIVKEKDLLDFFRLEVIRVTTSLNVEVDPHTAHYVAVEVLYNFRRSEEFFEDDDGEYCIKPLAKAWSCSTNITNKLDRRTAIERIGKVALFVVGFIPESLQRKGVDVEYFSNMGKSAFNSLHTSRSSDSRICALKDVFS